MPGGATSGTATLITSLPYSDTDTSPDAAGLWYRYVASTPNEIGVFTWSVAAISYYIFSPDATTPYPSGRPLAAHNLPGQMPVDAGVSYWINVKGAAGAYALSLVAGPSVAISTESLLIPDDRSTLPATVISETDGTVLQFVHPFPHNETGDILPNGRSLFQDRDTDHLMLYAGDLTLLADLTYGAATGDIYPIRSNKQHTFYVGTPSDAANAFNATVTTVTDAGAFGATTWNFPAAGLAAIAPNVAETILYYVQLVSTNNPPVKRWDLVNDLALTDLVAGPGATYQVEEGNLLVLADDTILVGYSRAPSSTAPAVIRYNSSGATLHTYTLTGSSSSLFRMALAPDDPDSFWVWTKLATTQGMSRFTHIKVSDGSTLGTFDALAFENGIYAGVETATPTVRFGHSQSCPFVVLPITTAALTGYRLPPRHDELLCQVIMTIASLAPDARQRMFNSLGVILSGAKLQTYEAGTTTPLATYSDAALTVPNSNPVIADSSGLFGPIYLLAQSYKFVLYDSNNLLVWSQDNVWDVGELLQATVTALTATVTANLALTQTKFCTTAFSQSTSASLANIIGLTGFTLTAGGVYKFDMNLAGTSGASGGVKYAFKYTTATLTNLEASGIGTTVSAVACQNATSTTDQATLYGQTAAVLNTRITGRITVNVGGTLAVQAAQNASDGTATTVAVGSWATFTKVS